MTILKMLTAATLAAASAACASGPKEPRGGERSAAASLNQSRLLLAHAREIQGERGCKQALPAYRVIASFGDGYETAQYELGACLLTIEGASDHETALFREEGLFWLKRAAWAGGARAQHRLAHLLSGADLEEIEGVAPAPVEALGWAMVYQENPTRALYALPPVKPPVLDHLRTTLAPELLAEADAFAAAFEKVSLAAFTPPPMARGNASNRRQGMPPGGRPDRRRVEDTASAQTDDDAV